MPGWTIGDELQVEHQESFLIRIKRSGGLHDFRITLQTPSHLTPERCELLGRRRLRVGSITDDRSAHRLGRGIAVSHIVVRLPECKRSGPAILRDRGQGTHISHDVGTLVGDVLKGFVVELPMLSGSLKQISAFRLRKLLTCPPTLTVSLNLGPRP
jgi:hypothetical protein